MLLNRLYCTLVTDKKTASHHIWKTIKMLTNKESPGTCFGADAQETLCLQHTCQYYISSKLLHVYQMSAAVKRVHIVCVSIYLSLQHVSSLDAWWPLLCAVGAPDRQTVSFALLLWVTGSRSRAAAASALYRHPSYLLGDPAPSSTPTWEAGKQRPGSRWLVGWWVGGLGCSVNSTCLQVKKKWSSCSQPLQGLLKVKGSLTDTNRYFNTYSGLSMESGNN